MNDSFSFKALSPLCPTQKPLTLSPFPLVVHSYCETSQMPPNLRLIIIFFLFAILVLASRARAIGVNWGATVSHPLPPPKVVELLKSNNINKVKLFDADPLVLQALSGSNLGVTVAIPNTMLRSLNSSKKAAESWVHDNVTRYISNGGSGVRIEYAFFFPLTILPPDFVYVLLFANGLF